MPAFSWTRDPVEAEREQLNLRELLNLKSSLAEPYEFGTGVAIGTAYDENTSTSVAVGVRFDHTGRCYGGKKVAAAKVDFPYLPGLYAFRVGPAVCAVLDGFMDDIDLLLVDGQGTAHPRGFGLASHIGVLYNTPAVGVTRNNLFGSYNEPPTGWGNHSPIINPSTGRTIGYALSLGKKSAPFFVSPGHLFSAVDAVQLALKVSRPDDAVPEPLKHVHRWANAEARKHWRQTKHNLLA